MKEYPKMYENFFSTGNLNTRVRKSDRLSFCGLTEEEFTANYRKILVDYYEMVWLTAVRMLWLKFFFSLDGTETAGDRFKNQKFFGVSQEKGWHDKNGLWRSFAIFPRDRLGMDKSGITEGYTFRQFSTYVLDFFPVDVLLSSNPFTNPDFYKFPLKNITLDLLLSVYQMSERMDLLKIADERKMTWEVFMDYVLNYISCFNEEHGKIIFTVVTRHPFPVYFRDARRGGYVAYPLVNKKGKARSYFPQKWEKEIPKL